MKFLKKIMIKSESICVSTFDKISFDIVSLIVVENKTFNLEMILFESLLSAISGWNQSEANRVVLWIFVVGDLMSTVSAVVPNCILRTHSFLDLLVDQPNSNKEEKKSNK